MSFARESRGFDKPAAYMLLGELDLNGGAFLHTLKECDEKLTGFVEKVGKIGGIISGSFAAFEGLRAIMEGFEKTLKLGSDLQDLHLATGQSVHDLVILQQAFTLTGQGAENVGPTLAKFQDAIAGVNEEGKSTAGALKALGLSAQELRTESALGQLEALQKGFAKVGDQSERVQIARDLFGKSGAQKLALLGDPEALEQARKQAEPLAEVMEKNVDAFDKLDDAIAGLKTNSLEFFAGALEKLAPNATEFADALSSINFVGIGRGVGELLNVFLDLGRVLIALGPVINTVAEAINAISLSGEIGGPAKKGAPAKPAARKTSIASSLDHQLAAMHGPSGKDSLLDQMHAGDEAWRRKFVPRAPAPDGPFKGAKAGASDDWRSREAHREIWSHQPGSPKAAEKPEEMRPRRFLGAIAEGTVAPDRFAGAKAGAIEKEKEEAPSHKFAIGGGILGALAGGGLFSLITAPLGAAMGAFVDKVVSGDQLKKKTGVGGFADEVRGAQPDMGFVHDQVSGMQKVGGGGGFGGGEAGGDPVLRESQKHTQILSSIDAKLGPNRGEPKADPPTV